MTSRLGALSAVPTNVVRDGVTAIDEVSASWPGSSACILWNNNITGAGFMRSEIEARIRRLEDTQEIQNLQARYAYCVDSGQRDKVPDLFAETFVAEWIPLGSFNTKPALQDFLMGNAARNIMTRHHVQTPLIEVQGDRATGTWYMFGPATTVTESGPVALWMQGTYENEFVRAGGQWKFSRLKFSFNFLTPFDEGWVKSSLIERR